MDRRAAGALLALAACIAASAAAPTATNHTALDVYDESSEGCYYNFQHYGEGDRIMTNEPCLNCTCHNRMLMCYLRVCPFTKAIGQDCTVEKRADQCCPIVTCPDVPVDLLTSTTSSPAEYGGTGVGKVDNYGCSINGKYFPEGAKVPPTPNKPCEHCYCIRNMTTCVMQECTLHVDGCTPIYHKDVCCPVRYFCDHPEDEMPLLDDKTTTVRPTEGFLLTTTTEVAPTTPPARRDCIENDQLYPDGALIKTEKPCEHCYCMKGDIVCVVQECGTPMENEGKNCTPVPPREGQCCPDTYICEGEELVSEHTTESAFEELTTIPPRRDFEGSGYRNEDEITYTEMPTFATEIEGSGEDEMAQKPLDTSDLLKPEKELASEGIDEMFQSTEGGEFIPKTTQASLLEESESATSEPDKGLNTVPSDISEDESKTTKSSKDESITTEPTSLSEQDMKPHIEEETHVHIPDDSTSLPEAKTTQPTLIEERTTVALKEITEPSVIDTTQKSEEIITEPSVLEGDSTQASIEPEQFVTTESTIFKEPSSTEDIHTTDLPAEVVTAQEPLPSHAIEQDTSAPSASTTMRSELSTEPTRRKEQDDNLQEPEKIVPTDSEVQITESDISVEKLTTPSRTADEDIETVAAATTTSEGLITMEPSLFTQKQEDESQVTTEAVPVEKETTEHDLPGAQPTIPSKSDEDVGTASPQFDKITPTDKHDVTEPVPIHEQNTVPIDTEDEQSSEPSILNRTTTSDEYKTTELPSKVEQDSSSSIPDKEISEPSLSESTTLSSETSSEASVIPDNEQKIELTTPVAEDVQTATTEPAFRKDDELASPEENLTKKDSEESTTLAAGITSDKVVSPEHEATTETTAEIEIKPTTQQSEKPDSETLAPTKETSTETIMELSTFAHIDENVVTSAAPSVESASTTPATDFTTINPEDNEIVEIPSPGRIPGEGDCLLEGVTYKNDSVVPSTNKCHTSCKCVSSIIKCDPIICSPPPEYMDNCQPRYDTPEACCPTYICDHGKETIPPQPHSQMSGTESPLPTIECSGDQCEISGETQPPTNIPERVGASDCGDKDCDEGVQKPLPAYTGECADGKCEVLPAVEQEKPTKEQCEGDHCEITPDGIPKPICDSEKGCESAPSQPCEGNNCESVPAVEPIPQVPTCDTEKGCESTPSQPCEGNNCESVPGVEPIPQVPICDAEKGCESTPSQPCEGNNCESVPGVEPIPQVPICDAEKGCESTPSQPCEGNNCESVPGVEPIPQVPTCDKEKGCESTPSQPCEGNNCESVPGVEPIPQVPICDAEKGCESTPSQPCEGNNCESVPGVEPISQVPACDTEKGCESATSQPCEGDNCKINPEDAPIPQTPTCDTEKGCEPALPLPCNGNECEVKPAVILPQEISPACENEEECKNVKVPELTVPQCEGESCLVLPKPTPADEICSEETGCKKPQQTSAECKDNKCEVIEDKIQPECTGTDCLQQQPVTPTHEQTHPESIGTESPVDQQTTISKETQTSMPAIAYTLSTDEITSAPEAITEIPDKHIEDHPSPVADEEEKTTKSPIDNTTQEISASESPDMKEKETAPEVPITTSEAPELEKTTAIESLEEIITSVLPEKTTVKSLDEAATTTQIPEKKHEEKIETTSAPVTLIAQEQTTTATETQDRVTTQQEPLVTEIPIQEEKDTVVSDKQDDQEKPMITDKETTTLLPETYPESPESTKVPISEDVPETSTDRTEPQKEEEKDPAQIPTEDITTEKMLESPQQPEQEGITTEPIIIPIVPDTTEPSSHEPHETETKEPVTLTQGDVTEPQEIATQIAIEREGDTVTPSQEIETKTEISTPEEGQTETPIEDVTKLYDNFTTEKLTTMLSLGSSDKPETETTAPDVLLTEDKQTSSETLEDTEHITTERTAMEDKVEGKPEEEMEKTTPAQEIETGIPDKIGEVEEEVKPQVEIEKTTPAQETETNATQKPDEVEIEEKPEDEIERTTVSQEMGTSAPQDEVQKPEDKIDRTTPAQGEKSEEELERTTPAQEVETSGPQKMDDSEHEEKPQEEMERTTPTQEVETKAPPKIDENEIEVKPQEERERTTPVPEEETSTSHRIDEKDEKPYEEEKTTPYEEKETTAPPKMGTSEQEEKLHEEMGETTQAQELKTSTPHKKDEDELATIKPVEIGEMDRITEPALSLVTTQASISDATTVQVLTAEKDTTNEPEQVQPEKTEPEMAEPEKPEPENIEPEKAEPEKTEPEKTEPEKTEPEKTEPGKIEPEMTDAEVTTIASEAEKTPEIPLETETESSEEQDISKPQESEADKHESSAPTEVPAVTVTAEQHGISTETPASTEIVSPDTKEKPAESTEGPAITTVLPTSPSVLSGEDEQITESVAPAVTEDFRRKEGELTTLAPSQTEKDSFTEPAEIEEEKASTPTFSSDAVTDISKVPEKVHVETELPISSTEVPDLQEPVFDDKYSTKAPEIEMPEKEQDTTAPETQADITTKTPDVQSEQELTTGSPLPSDSETKAPLDEEAQSLKPTEEEVPTTAVPETFSVDEHTESLIDHETLVTREPEPVTTEQSQVVEQKPEQDQQQTDLPVVIVTEPQELSTEKYDIPDKLQEPTESVLVEIPAASTLSSYDGNETEQPLQTSKPDVEPSETTPYLVELEEHTHKIYEEPSTAVPSEDATTARVEVHVPEEERHTTETPIEKLPDAERPQTTETSQMETKMPTEQKDEMPSDAEEPNITASSVPMEETTSSTTSNELLDKFGTPEKDASSTTQKPILEQEQTTVAAAKEPEQPIKYPEDEASALPEKDITPKPHDVPVETTAPEEEFIPVTSKVTTTPAEKEATTQSPIPFFASTSLPEVQKPDEPQPTDEVPSPDDEGQFPPSGGYNQEPDYGEEDQAFGPGTCRYGGKVYVSAQQIPRDDPCDFCFCFRSDIICLQQSCPPPIHGCHEEPIQGFCCPRYECPVSMATTLNVTTTTTTTTTTLPPHFLPHAYKGAAQRRGCQIKGHTYKVGEVVRASSGPCLHCTCGGDGQMKCDPKACTPEPMLRQMIAAAVSAKRRR